MDQITSFIEHPPSTLYERLILHQKGRAVFTVLTFFLLAFVLSRGAVYIYQFNVLPKYPFANVFGTHIHHFVFGIALVVLVGFLSLTLPQHVQRAWHLKLAALYGFGLGWIMDEFGMWLHLEDNYFIRGSYDAIIITLILLINFVYLGKIWKHLFYKIFKKFTI